MPLSDTERNKELIRRWIAFANAGFDGSFDPFVSVDYIGHIGATTMDRAELERLERQFGAIFPDANYTIDDLIAEGNRVVVRTTASGNASMCVRRHSADGPRGRVHWAFRLPHGRREDRRIVGRDRFSAIDGRVAATVSSRRSIE
jgi:predicted ester cyclase